jgi:cob(I)alamin adenosyltransferase
MPPSRLYSRSGDAGVTHLIGGRKVSKEDARVEAYGAVDELASNLGLAQSELPPELSPVAAVLERLQHELFILGAELATPEGKPAPQQLLQDRHVRRVEEEIELFSGPSEGLRTFVLPRGSKAASQLHVARAVARRAERAVVRLHRSEPQRPPVLAYMNRLSSLLFALAVQANKTAGVAEVPPDYTR